MSTFSARMGPEIVVVTYGLPPSEEGSRVVRLARELDLTRPALLYSNRVRVISSAYALNSMFASAFGSMETTPEYFVDFLANLVPVPARVPGLADAVIARSTLQSSIEPGERRRAQATLSAFVQEFVEDMQVLGVSLLEGAVDLDGLNELNDAVGKGSLTLESPPNLGLEAIGNAMRGMAIGVMQEGELPADAAASLSPLVQSLVRTLVTILDDPNAFPILDHDARQVIEHRGLGDARALAAARSRIAGTASLLLGQLPMADAPLGDILEIRHHLADHLAGFELKVEELAREVSPAQWEAGFEEEVTHLYTTRVEPETRELEAKLDDVLDRFRTARRVRGLRIALATGQGLTEGWVANAMGQVPTGAVSRAISRMLEALSAPLETELRALKGNRLYYFVGGRELLAYRDG